MALLGVLVLSLAASFAMAKINVTKSLKIVTILHPPFVMKNQTTGKFSGLFVDVLQHMGVHIDHMDVVHGDTYGVEEHPGQWTGVMGELAKGKYDLAVAPFSIRSTRAKAVTFSQPVLHAGYLVLYKLPKDFTPTPLPLTTLVEPFSPGLWVLIFLMCFLTSIVLYFIRRFSPYEEHVSMTSKIGVHPSMLNNMLFTFSSLLGQNHKTSPKSLSARVMTMTWWMFALMTVGAYIAGLAVVVFKEKPQSHALPFREEEEMVHQSKVKVLGIKNSETYYYIGNHSGHWEQEVYKMWKANWDTLMVDSMDQAMKMMEEGNGKYAIFMDEASADYKASQEPCDKVVLGGPVGDNTFGFACPKGSTVCDDMNDAILHLHESGQIEKLREKWFFSGCHTGHEDFEQKSSESLDGAWTNKLSSFNIRKFASGFILLAIGLGLALVVLAGELFFARSSKDVRMMTGHNGRHSGDLQRIGNDYTPED